MLNIRIRSFSYKKGIPEDASGNGGGFVFDCRGILNPGRLEEFKTQSGRDLGVIQYLESETRMADFLESVFKLIDLTVEDYLQRGFTNLEVNFGCTGGQHRSVYSADALKKHLEEKFPQVQIHLNHREQEAKNWVN